MKTEQDIKSEDIIDKKTFARIWRISPRSVDKLMADGLPHLKMGKRNVRLILPTCNKWMVERYGAQKSK